MWKGKLVDFFLFLSDKSGITDYDGEVGYIRFIENSGNILTRLIKPKNIFLINSIIGSGTTNL